MKVFSVDVHLSTALMYESIDEIWNVRNELLLISRRVLSERKKRNKFFDSQTKISLFISLMELAAYKYFQLKESESFLQSDFYSTSGPTPRAYLNDILNSPINDSFSFITIFIALISIFFSSQNIID
jgi:hypothetical protein